PDPRRYGGPRLRANRPRKAGVEDAGAAQVALEAPDALALPLLFDPFEVNVRARVVRGRMRRGAVGEGLDERRPVACARPGDRLARRLVARERIRPVDAHTRHAVA